MSAQIWVLENPTVTPLLLFLIQLFLTLAMTRILGWVFAYLKQPQVVGEIIGGIILGQSVFGQIPGYTEAIWPTHVQLANGTYNSVTTFQVVANVGLILFMFLMGMELDNTLLKKSLKTSLPIAVAAIACPFGVGALSALWLQDINKEGAPEGWQPPRQLSFILFTGASMAFTAFPVLSAILQHANLVNTPLGAQAMSCAAIGDVLAWCVLAIASSFAKSGAVVNGLYTCALSVGYVIVMVVVVRPLLWWVHARVANKKQEFNRYYLCLLFLMLVASAFATELIGIHAFFGAFLFGLLVPSTNAFTDILFPRCELVVTEVLLPLYFVNSGIATNIGSLNSGKLWGVTAAVIVIACAAKFLPVVTVTKLLTRKSWRHCTTMGILMNTRGLVEVIALNIGLSLGILTDQMFSLLILMAIATTLLTAPLVWLIYQRHLDKELSSTSATPESPRTPASDEASSSNAVVVSSKVCEADGSKCHNDSAAAMDHALSCAEAGIAAENGVAVENGIPAGAKHRSSVDGVESAH